MKTSLGPVLVLLAGLAPVPTMAASPASLSVSGPWMRALTGKLPAAGYFTLTNTSDHSVQLVGAASPACGSLTLHQTSHRHTMSAMSAMDPDNPRGTMAMGAGGSMGPDGSVGAAGGMSMSSMQPVAAVAVPAGGTLRFSPGGYHLMCEQPTGALQPGQSIPVTLQLGDGSSIAIQFPVRGPRG